MIFPALKWEFPIKTSIYRWFCLQTKPPFWLGISQPCLKGSSAPQDFAEASSNMDSRPQVCTRIFIEESQECVYKYMNIHEYDTMYANLLSKASWPSRILRKPNSSMHYGSVCNPASLWGSSKIPTGTGLEKTKGYIFRSSRLDVICLESCFHILPRDSMETKSV
jgi:hypothetical protein